MPVSQAYFQNALARRAARLQPSPLQQPQYLPQEQPLTPEEERSILGELGSGAISGLSAAGNLLDLPGSMARDILTLNNPFDQLFTPLSHENRVSGRELLHNYGLATENDPTRWELADVAGFGTEFVADPFFWPAKMFGVGARAADAAGAAGDTARLFSGPSIGQVGLKAAYDAVPQRAKDIVSQSPVGDTLRAGRRVARGLFKQEYGNQFTESGQDLAKSLYDANQAVGPEMRAAMAANREMFGAIDTQVRDTLGPDLLAAMRDAPIQPDPRDIFHRASEIAQLEQHGFEEGTAAIRRFKAENPDLVGQVRAAHRRGDDWTTIPRWDEVTDGLRGDQEQLGTEFSQWEDEDFWTAFLNRHDRPVRGDFIQNAEQELMGEYPANLPSGLRPSDVVQAHGGRYRRYGDLPEDAIPELGDVPEFGIGMLTKIGTRESDVLFKKGDRFESLRVPNERIFRNTNPEIAEQQANAFFEKVSSDIARAGAETSTLNPRSYEEAISREFERYAGLDETNIERYQPLVEKMREAFGGMGDDGLGIAGAVKQFKDTIYADVQAAGGDVHWHRVEDGFQTDHWPRYVPAKLVNDFKKSGITAGEFNTAFESMKARTPAIRDIPTHVVEELLTSPKYRKADAEQRILEDFRGMLDEEYGLRPEESLDSLLDDTNESFDFDLSFDTSALESGGGGATAHAAALAELVKSHRRGTLFGNVFKADMDRYIRGAYRTKAGLLGLHEFIHTSAAKLKPGTPSRSVAQMYQSMGLNIDESRRLFEEKYGIAGADFDRMRIPVEAARAAAGYKKIMNPQKYLEGPIFDFLDEFNRWFKTGVTVPFPGFHFRNFISGQAVNLTIGDAKLFPYSKSVGRMWKLVRDAQAGRLSDEQMELVESAFRHKVIDPMHAGYGVEQAPVSVAEMGDISQLIPPALGPGMIESRAKALDTISQAEVPDYLRPLYSLPGATSTRATLQQIIGTGSNAGKLAEFMNRMSMYEYLLKEGVSEIDAAKQVERLHFDYSKHSAFEAGIARRVVPFWTFGRRMAELTADELMKEPGGRLAQLIRATRLGQQDTDDSGVPEYVATTTSLPLGQLEDGSQRYVTGFGLAHEDPLSFLTADAHSGLPDMGDGIAEVISRMTPLIKAPIELATGESFFQRGPMGGRDLIDADPTLGRLASNISEWTTGQPVESPSGRAYPLISNEFEHLMANTPLARLISTARTLTDPRKWSGTLPGAAAATNFLTGARVTDISPASQDAVTREYAQAYARENLDAKAYQTVYIPKEEIAEVRKSDPERARKMEVINRMRQIFKKRREEREGGKLAGVLGGSLPPGG